MRTLLLTLLTSCLLVFSAIGQDRRDETRIDVYTETGDTVITESVIVSLTEDITPRSGMIIINPLKFLLFYNISYFHKLSDNAVIGGGFQIPTLSGIEGFGVNTELRLYPKGKNLKGFYIAPNISFNHITSGGESTSPFSLGALIGWQWFPGDEFAIGFGIGADYYIGSVSNQDNNIRNYDGFAPALRFDIGYAW